MPVSILGSDLATGPWPQKSKYQSRIFFQVQTENSVNSLVQLITLLLDKTSNQIKNLSRLLANVQREEIEVAIGITREWFQITQTTLVTRSQHHHQLKNQEQPMEQPMEPIQVSMSRH